MEVRTTSLLVSMATAYKTSRHIHVAYTCVSLKCGLYEFKLTLNVSVCSLRSQSSYQTITMELLIEKPSGNQLFEVVIGTYEEYVVGYVLCYDESNVSDQKYQESESLLILLFLSAIRTLMRSIKTSLITPTIEA
jgi:hypothetical protein